MPYIWHFREALKAEDEFEKFKKIVNSQNMKKENKRIIKRTIGVLLIGEIVALFAGFFGYALDEDFMRIFTIVNCVYGWALVSFVILELICWFFKDDPEE